MNINDLQIGDKVRIVAVPGEGIDNYNLQKETRAVYKKIISRNAPVRINEIDEWGNRWYSVRFKRYGRIEHHFLNITQDDTNWVKVKKRKKLGDGRG